MKITHKLLSKLCIGELVQYHKKKAVFCGYTPTLGYRLQCFDGYNTTFFIRNDKLIKLFNESHRKAN